MTAQTVIYGEDLGQPLSAQVTAPVGARSLPAVLVVHGGAWAHGSSELMVPSSTAIAEAGFVTFNIDYRLATPTSPGFPYQLDDLQQAVAYLRQNASVLGVDPAKVGVLGTSAGGNLALLLADMGQGSCTAGLRVSAVVTWSAPDDLASYGAAHEQDCEGGDSPQCPMLYRAAEEYLGCPLPACPKRWDEASVPEHVSGDDPPTLLFNSSDELVPLSQPRALSALLTKDGDPNRLVVLPGRRHAIAYAAQALPGTITFFREYLG